MYKSLWSKYLSGNKIKVVIKTSTVKLLSEDLPNTTSLQKLFVLIFVAEVSYWKLFEDEMEPQAVITKYLL